MTAPTTAARPSTFEPLRVVAYRRLWTASLVNHIGTFLLLVAGPWLMLQMTRSPLMVSLVTASLLLPRLLLTLPAGAMADAIDRRTMAMSGNWGGAAAMSLLAVLAWQDRLTPGLLLVLCVAVGCGGAIAQPAYLTLVPELVDERLIPPATALNSAGFNVARAVGPAIGGVFVAADRADVAFAVSALTHLVVIGALLATPSTGQADRAGLGLMRSTRAGLRYARFTRPLMLILVTATAFTVTSSAVQVLLPTVAQDDLQMGADGFGLLLGSFGLGALAGALGRERLRASVRNLLPWAIVTFGVAGTAFGLSRIPVLSVLLLAVAGASWVAALSTMNSTVQVMTPRWVRGRAMSMYMLAVVGVQPLAAVAAGTLAELVGSATTVAISAALAIPVGLVARRAGLPVLGDVVPPVLPEDWVTPPHEQSVPGSPVVVQNTWRVRAEDVPEYLRAMRVLRRHRLRTGAERWKLWRHADDPTLFIEAFQVHDWEEHLAQHRRIDAEAAAAIRRARSFNVDGEPVTIHIVGVDPYDERHIDVPTETLARHEEMHEVDGSVPLPQQARSS